MKKTLILLTIVITLLGASNFRDGMIYYRNGNFEEAKKSFELAISQDHALQANFMLGKMYLYGEGVPAERKKAIKYLEKVSQSGNIRADCYLSEAYIQNNTNRDKAISLLKYGLMKGLKECKRIARIYNINTKQEVKK